MKLVSGFNNFVAFCLYLVRVSCVYCSVLSSPRSLQLSLVQEDPPVVSMQWQAPRTDPSLVLGYRVQYGPSKSETFEEEKLDPAIYKFTSGFLGEKSI